MFPHPPSLWQRQDAVHDARPVTTTGRDGESATTSPTPSATPGNTHAAASPALVVATVVVVFVVVFALSLYCSCQKIRSKHQNPKYIPTTRLKNAWTRWTPRIVQRHRALRNADEHEDTQLAQTSSTTSTTPASTEESTSTGVGRAASQRSIMTLPAYNPLARHDERTIGREGERGGIDVVVEFPEAAEDDELRRQQEMEALYQVRLGRRRENEDRDERHQLRREARERGDFAALRDLQNPTRGHAAVDEQGRTVSDLRAEHDRIRRERARAVSSVSYADLGVARHDGSRLQGSFDDGDVERQGLLGDAASFGEGGHHHRMRSNSSNLSIDTLDLAPGRLRGNSQPGTPLRMVNTTSSDVETDRAGSSPELVEGDDYPLHSPPGYENIPLGDNEPPPGYSSRVNSLRNDRTLPEPSVRSGASREIMSQTGMVAAPDTSSSVNSLPHRLPSLHLAGTPVINLEPSTPLGNQRQDGSDNMVSSGRVS